MQTITFELPDSLYRSIRRIAAITQQPVESVVKEGLSHFLPPLDDLPEEDVSHLAALSQLDNAGLWREARGMLSQEFQDELEGLLERQGAGDLSEEARPRLHRLMDAFGQLTVRKSHAWLLLARRGYNVPPQLASQE